MAIISRGFAGRSREHNPELPPGQYLTEDFPVLSAGPTPELDTAEWTFTVQTGEFTLTPSHERLIAAGDVMIIIGPASAIYALEALHTE